jgi:uncharacterized protein (TIGR03083 family)
MLASAEQSAAAYGAVRARIATVFASLSEDDLARPVPACPAWTVKDLAGHLAGNAEDVANVNLEGVASEAWTDAQVQRARERSLDELLDAWATNGATVEQLLPHAPPGPAAQLVFDTCTHEQDLHGALGRIGDRDHDQLPIALTFMAHTLDGAIRGLGLPTLELRTDHEHWVLGDGEPDVRFEGTRFDLLRGLGGRRTRDELTALVTLGSFEPFELLFAPPSPLRLPERSLGE